MNLNKDPSSWAQVSAKAVMTMSPAAIQNVLKMALEDIQRLGKADDDRCCQWAAGIAEGVKLRRNTHTNPEVYALGWERGVNAVVRTFRALALR